MKNERQDALPSDREVFEVIRGILARYKPQEFKQKRGEILRAIDRALPHLSMLGVESMYLYHASINQEKNLRHVFTDLFFERIKKAGIDNLTGAALLIEGVHDLWYTDRLRGFYLSKSKTGPADSSTVQRLYSHACYDDALIIIGETGTSKQGIARAIHLLSERRDRPFVEINCAALPENMLEAELFGYKKGAFTGADKDRPGIIETANDGYFFLDELGKMPKYLQAKLLKVINDKELRRLGENDTRSIDVRFIAALQPNDLMDVSNEHQYRVIPDLLYRLGYPDCIELPPLYERMTCAGKSGMSSVVGSAMMEVSKMLHAQLMVDDSCYKIISSYKYEKGNYRELIAFLRAAGKSALENNRTLIKPNDLDLLKNHIEKSSPSKVEEASVSYLDIKLKDIIDYGEKVSAEIIKAKVQEVIDAGGKIEAVLRKEGLKTKSQYQSFRNKVKRRTGLDISEFQKRESSA